MPIFNCGLIPPRLATKTCRKTWQPQRTLEDILPQLILMALFHANIQQWTHSTTFGNKNLLKNMAAPEDIGGHIAPIDSDGSISCQYSTVDSFHHVWQQKPAGGHGSPRGHWRKDILPQLISMALFYANIQQWTHSTTFANKNLLEDMAAPQDTEGHIAPIGSNDSISFRLKCTVSQFKKLGHWPKFALSPAHQI